MAAERSARHAKPRPRRGGRARNLKMTSLHAEREPARPAVRKWLQSFLLETIF